MSHLVIIDGHAIAHRAYHSIPPLTVDGQPVNALYGFFSMLLSAVDTLKPDYLIVCLDSPGQVFRNEEFLGYRAKRAPTDHDLVTQLPLIPQALDTACIKNFATGGFEADDLIATIASRSLKKHSRISHVPLISHITIITGDKDLMQLVNKKINLFVPVRGLSETKIYDEEAVKEKLGVNPGQVVDLKALMGDSSDNYPGVAGIGPKTATDLLSKYQTLDNIYKHLSDLSDLLSSRLIKDRDNAYLSQKLAKLVSTVPLKLNLRSTCWRQDNIFGLQALFDQYRFKSLSARLKRYYPDIFKSSSKPTIDINQGSLF